MEQSLLHVSRQGRQFDQRSCVLTTLHFQPFKVYMVSDFECNVATQEWTHITGNLILNGPSGNQICKVKPHGPNVPCPGNHGNPGNTGSCGLFPTIDNDDGSAYFSAEGNVLIYGGAKNYL
eukprot:SAG11_NODE_326_length_10708_cov_6.937035_6_plen_121_part_00